MSAAVSREVARLSLLYASPWVIGSRTVAGVTIFTARRPGLALSQGSAQALEDELQMWEHAPAPRLTATPVQSRG